MQPRSRSGDALLSALTRHLEQPRFRYGLYGVISLVCLAAALFGARIRGEFNFILSDGGGYYAYLPSVVFDHDLDLSNQIRPGWTTQRSPLRMDKRTELGYIKNKYPVGFALGLFFFYEWAAQGRFARKLLAGIGVLACLGFNYFLMFLYISSRIPRGKSPI